MIDIGKLGEGFGELAWKTKITEATKIPGMVQPKEYSYDYYTYDQYHDNYDAERYIYRDNPQYGIGRNTADRVEYVFSESLLMNWVVLRWKDFSEWQEIYGSAIKEFGAPGIENKEYLLPNETEYYLVFQTSEARISLDYDLADEYAIKMYIEPYYFLEDQYLLFTKTYRNEPLGFRGYSWGDEYGEYANEHEIYGNYDHIFPYSVIATKKKQEDLSLGAAKLDAVYYIWAQVPNSIKQLFKGVLIKYSGEDNHKYVKDALSLQFGGYSLTGKKADISITGNPNDGYMLIIMESRFSFEFDYWAAHFRAVLEAEDRILEIVAKWEEDSLKYKSRKQW